MCLELSPLIVYPIIDRLLGGNSSEMFIPQRPLTSIEWRLINRLVERALEHLVEAWRNLVETRFEVVEMESNPQLVHIVAPTEVVVFITFEIKMAEWAGTMSMCIPFNTIESVLSKLTTQSWFGYCAKQAKRGSPTPPAAEHHARDGGHHGLPRHAKIKVSDLRGLRSGDLIEVDKRVDGDLIMQIEGLNKFAGAVGQLRGRRALRLRRAAKEDEPL